MFGQQKIERLLSSYLTVMAGTFIHVWRDKGQLISKADMKVFIWTKKLTKIFLYFCPSLKNESIKKIMAHYHAN